MRKRTMRTLFGILLTSMAALSFAQAGISVTVDGQPVNFLGTGPQMVNGRVLVPLRGVFERLGAYVQWNAAHHQVVATRGQNTVELQIGDSNAMVDGRQVTLDVPAQIVDGSTMVPIRFVSESIGAQVNWREAEQMVVIQSGGQPAQPEPSNEAPAVQPDGDAAGGNSGPVRMARISWADGAVNWRPGDDVDWSSAAVNLPLRQGAEIWLDPGARAEIQFDDGSVLRLGSGGLATLQTMFADDTGEFTEIRMNTGTATLRLTNNLSTYQVDTPLASVKAAGPADFRIDDTNGLRVAVRDGAAQAQGAGGQVSLQPGDYLNLIDAGSPFAIVPAPGEDAWDRFCDQRDGVLLNPSPNLPSNIALVAGDLDSYGTWISDPQYGACWRPRVDDPDWAPYQTGRWVWVSPFGWTWCATEAWGWAPYHYGTWFRSPGGWAWRPGPAQQYWSPAVVHFSTNNGAIAWCALAPSEVRYPAAISVGVRLGNWSLNFSIGGAACYYPAGPSYCAPRPWTNAVINRTTNVYNVTRITNIPNTYVSNQGFVPRNSRVPGGASVTTAAGFSSGARFSRVAGANAAIFTKGQSFAPPAAGSVRYAGPTSVKPTAASFSPSHSFTASRPSPALLSRPVVRAPLPVAAANVAKPMPDAKTLPRRAPDVTSAAPNTSPAAPVRRPPARTAPVVARPARPVAPQATPRPARVAPAPPTPRPANPARPASPVRVAPRPVAPRPIAPRPAPVAKPVVPPLRPRPAAPRPIPPVKPVSPPAPRPSPVAKQKPPPPVKPAPRKPAPKPAPKKKPGDIPPG